MTDLTPFFEGDIRALSRVISRIESGTSDVPGILSELYKKGGRSIRIGITGPPGAGKSTLVNCLVHSFLAENKRVGIIAVDPTSPFTGGALLGDRVRMHEFPIDGSVYFRSMATRGASGGLAGSTQDAALALDAFGFEVTLIETVGVGQVELDIMDTCDAVIVVVVPESGDAVQTMKAGLMEIANIFAVNKADRPGAEKLARELEHTLHLRTKISDEPEPKVVLTDAVNRKNTDELHRKVAEYLTWSKESGAFERRRRHQITKKIISILKARFQQHFVSQVMQESSFDSYVAAILRHEEDPYHVGEELYQRFAAEAEAASGRG